MKSEHKNLNESKELASTTQKQFAYACLMTVLELLKGPMRHLGNFGVYGGVGVGFYLITASKEVQQKFTCENMMIYQNDIPTNEYAATFLYDYGLLSFYLGGMGYLLVPSTCFLFDQITRHVRDKDEPIADVIQGKIERRYGETPIKILSTINKIFMQVLTSPFFIKEAIDQAAQDPQTGAMRISDEVRYGLYALGAIPLIIQLTTDAYLFYKHGEKYPDYPSWEELKKQFPNEKTARMMGITRATLIGMMCASAAIMFVWTIINNFYNGSHDENFQHSDIVLLVSAAVTFIIGVASVPLEYAEYIAKIALSINLFNIASNSFESTLLCLSNPRKSENTTYYANNVEPWIGALDVVMLAVSFAYVYYVYANDKKDEMVLEDFPENKIESYGAINDGDDKMMIEDISDDEQDVIVKVEKDKSHEEINSNSKIENKIIVEIPSEVKTPIKSSVDASEKVLKVLMNEVSEIKEPQQKQVKEPVKEEVKEVIKEPMKEAVKEEPTLTGKETTKETIPSLKENKAVLFPTKVLDLSDKQNQTEVEPKEKLSSPSLRGSHEEIK